MGEKTNKYLEIYYKNEHDANKQMSYACLFIGILLAAVYIVYATGLAAATRATLIMMHSIFPALIVTLFSTLILVKTPFQKRPGFKYFLLILFTVVIVVLSIVLPKHAILAFSLCIILANHYYNPKASKIVFFTLIGLYLITMYASLFLGEYDPYLLMGELDDARGVITHYSTTQVWEDSVQGRYEYIKYLNEVLGHHRYFEVLLFYYLPRAVVLFGVFMVSNSLSKRTYKLLLDEIHVNSEQEKTNVEINVARDIQLQTLPDNYVASEDFAILAELKAAKEVGGDFYDYMKVDDDHMAILIGDVSGKGIPAAMFMMKTITCFKNFIVPGIKPSEVLKKVNKAIYEGNINMMFATCFLAIINIKTGEVIFSNAGHNPPVIGDEKHYRYLKCEPGFLLGTMEECFVSDETLTLKKGEMITLYTDGITEARNDKGEFYGEKRLVDLMNSRSFNSIVELHHELKDDIDIFVNGADQSDDITYLSFKFHGDKIIFKESLFEAKQENVESSLDEVKEFIKENHIPNSIGNNLVIVVDEIVSNIVKFAYKDTTGNVFIRLMYNDTKKIFHLTIIDQGIAFNQLEVNNPPLEVNEKDEYRIGGLGILMVKEIMDEYSYDRINGKNILVFTKKL